MHPVFISYARRTSAQAARALHGALGEEAFFDQEDIATGDCFPERIVDALLGSRVVVVFPDESYFEQLFCRWELQASLEFVARDPSEENLSHLVIVLPAGNRPSELDRFPPRIQTTSWTSADDTARVVELVRRQLERSRATLGRRYVERGNRDVRAQLLELSENQPPRKLAGIRKYPAVFPASKGDQFVGRANDLWRIDFALGTLRGVAALTGSIEGAGGVGKTQLAREYLYRFAPRRFQDGIFWIDAEGDLETQHHGVLRALDPAVPDLSEFRKAQRKASAELAEALDRAAAGAGILFVVDNVPQTPLEPLSKWCPALSKVTVLTTSRAKLSVGEAVIPVPIEALEAGAAEQLLTAGALPASSQDARQVAEWVGYLPLALTVLNAALRLKGTTIEKLAMKARSPAGQTAELDAQMAALRPHVAKGALRGVTEAFSESYRLLAPDIQEAARLLARLAPAAIPVELIDELGFGPSARMGLVKYSLVTEAQGGGPASFGSMHRVLADYLRTRSEDPKSEWRRASAALEALMRRASEFPADWNVMQAVLPHTAHVLHTFPPAEGVPDAAALAGFARFAFAASKCLSALGQPAGAVVAGEEVLKVRRQLAAQQPELYLQDLAESLAAYSTDLLSMGRRQEGMKAAQEALDIYRALMVTKPADVLPGLGATLSTVHLQQGWPRMRVEQLATARESVEVYRKLAAERPNEFMTDLAGTLSSLARCLEQAGQKEEAARTLQEGEQVARAAANQLRGQNGVQARTKRVLALNLLAGSLLDQGRHAEGSEASLEAVEVCRGLDGPVASGVLAISLLGLGGFLLRAGMKEEALLAAQEAADRMRELGRQMPDSPHPEISMALLGLAACLSELGRHEEELGVVRELVARGRRMAEIDREVGLVVLCAGLLAESNALARLGRPFDAIGPGLEAHLVSKQIAAMGLLKEK